MIVIDFITLNIINTIILALKYFLLFKSISVKMHCQENYMLQRVVTMKKLQHLENNDTMYLLLAVGNFAKTNLLV
jgi:hypothetical protein